MTQQMHKTTIKLRSRQAEKFIVSVVTAIDVF